jgi:hypothetical protein
MVRFTCASVCVRDDYNDGSCVRECGLPIAGHKLVEDNHRRQRRGISQSSCVRKSHMLGYIESRRRTFVTTSARAAGPLPNLLPYYAVQITDDFKRESGLQQYDLTGESEDALDLQRKALLSRDNRTRSARVGLGQIEDVSYAVSVLYYEQTFESAITRQPLSSLRFYCVCQP